MKGGQLNFALVGAGVIAPSHIHAIEQCSRARLVAIYDQDRDRAGRRVAESKSREARVVSTFEEVLEDGAVDVVDVIVPSGLHERFAVPAAQAGKHLLVEKPLEITLPAVDRIIEAVNKAGVKLAVSFQRRFMPGFCAAREAVRSGALGPMVFGNAYLKAFRSRAYYRSAAWRGTWALDGGGALMNQGIHGVDALLWTMGPVARVFARADHLARDIEVEDTAMAVLEYESGAFGVIEAATSANPGMPIKLEFAGEKGTAVADEKGLSFFAVEKEFDTLAEDDPARHVRNPEKAWHDLVVQDLVDAIEKDMAPRCGGEEGRRSVELILAIYESARTGRDVALSRSAS
ncbi:MAG: Gfo/Idh/MocA family oxidoreductase [Planctomycetota bacterium]